MKSMMAFTDRKGKGVVLPLTRRPIRATFEVEISIRRNLEETVEKEARLKSVMARFVPHLRPFVREIYAKALAEPLSPDEAADTARGLAALNKACEAASMADESEFNRVLGEVFGGLEQKLLDREVVDTAFESAAIAELMKPPTDAEVDEDTDKSCGQKAESIVIFWYWALGDIAADGVLRLSSLDSDGLPPGDWISKAAPKDIDVRSALKAFLDSMNSDERPIPAEMALVLMEEDGLTIVP